jgi:hypothetical protein
MIIQTSRAFSTRSAVRNSTTATSMPIGEAMRNVAERAQSAVTQQASIEGFKAGVVYTVLAGSVATAGIMLLTPTGQKTVESRDLL